MKFFGKIEDYAFWFLTTLASAASAGVVWLVRTVFTNKAQIDLLTQSLHDRDEHRDGLRQEDRAAIEDVRKSVKRIEGVLMSGHSGKDEDED